jgi:DNA polymerase III delta subunit
MRRLYLLFGSDPVLAEEIIAALKEKAVTPGLEAFDLEVVHATDIGGDRLGVTQLLQHVRQLPAGSARRLVVIRDLGLLDKRVGRELCAGMAKAIGDSTVVAVTCEYDKSWADIFRATGLSEYVFATGAPEGEALTRMVRRWAQARRLKLDDEAVAALIEAAGEETALLRGEVEKLATVCDPGARVSVEQVRRLVSHTRTYELAEYVGLLADGDTAGALRVLHRLAEWDEEPIKIVGWLAKRLLWRVPEAKGEKLDHLNRALNRLYIINRSILLGYPEPYALLDLFTVCLGCSATPPCDLAAREPRPEFCLRPQYGDRTERSRVGAS